MGDGLRINRSVTIPAEELDWRFTASGGPGGQHANRSATRAEVTWNVRTSRALGPRQRERLIFRLGSRLNADGTLRVVSDRRRSQLRNREAALTRLAEIVRSALEPEARRIQTQPTEASRRRRLEAKRRRAGLKRLRRAHFDLDDQG
jgi:ribosome-associated protein